MQFERRAGDFLVSFDETRLARVLDPAIGAHERRAVNARFQITGDRVRVLPDRPGIGLDKSAALAEITAAAYSPDRRVADIRLTDIPAEIQADALTSLGITRKVSSFTTDMGVSSSNRIWNVQLMARYIDGTIIEPGEVFSFNRVVGQRTVERGFREGQMIVGSLLLRRSAAASARPRRLFSTTRSSSASRSSSGTTTASTSATIRWAATPRSPGAARTSSSGTTCRPGS